MDTTNSEPSTNSLIAAFRRGLNAFSHALRSPLSVISNDLAYWERSLGAEEVQRGKQTVTRISNLLEELEKILKPLSEDKTSVNIIELLNAKGASQTISREVDLNRLKGALDSLCKIFLVTHWNVKSLGSEFELLGTSDSIRMDLKEPCTLTEYSYSKNGGINVLKALDFDLVISMHGGKAMLHSDGLHLSI